MSQQFFLDTSFLVALLDQADIQHKRAKSLFGEISKDQNELFLSDVVLNETLTVFARRFESKKRGKEFSSFVQQLKTQISNWPILCLYELVGANFNSILDKMSEFKAVFSFHDVLILFFLKEVPETTLVSFDTDFKHVPNLALMS